jgi:hypothetical protein
MVAWNFDDLIFPDFPYLKEEVGEFDLFHVLVRSTISVALVDSVVVEENLIKQLDVTGRYFI